MALSSQHFWCKVGRRSAEASSLRIVHNTNFGESEISEQGVAILVKNDVVWLQIPKNDVSFVEVF